MAQTGELWTALLKAANAIASHHGLRRAVYRAHQNSDINWLLRNGSAHMSYEDYTVHIRFPGGKLVYSPPAYEDHRTAYHITRLFQ